MLALYLFICLRSSQQHTAVQNMCTLQGKWQSDSRSIKAEHRTW